MNRPNSAHDSLSETDMQDCLLLCSQMLRKGGHLLLFSAKSQTQEWIRLLSSMSDMSVDRVPLYVLNARNNLSQPPFRMGNKYTNMVSEVVHAVKLGGGTSAYGRVQYQNHGYVQSSYPATMNVIDNVPKLVPGEKLMKSSKDAWRPEQKPISLLKELIERHSLPGAIVADPFAGTYSTAVACLQLPSPRKFVGCEIDSGCHAAATARLFHHFVDAVVKDRFPLLAENASLLRQARTESAAASAPSARTGPLTQPKHWPRFCALPDHLVAHVCTATRNMSQYDSVKGVELAKWPPQMLTSFLALDPATLLAADSTYHSVYVDRSSIPGAENGVFAATDIDRDTVIGWYSGTFVHTNITKGRYAKLLDGSMYGGPTLGCTIARFHTYAMGFSDPGTDSTLDDEPPEDAPKPGSKVYVVPPPYCAASYINDKKKLNNGLEPKNAISRKANAAFEQKRPPFTFRRLINPYYVFVVTLRRIKKGEEILLNYGSSYWK